MKNYKVFLTPDAIQDLMDIYEYITEKSGLPEIAWIYLEKLREKCYGPGITPLIGQQRDDLRENLRIIAIDRNAVAAFEVNEDKQTVTILNIFYGGRDYEAIMGGGMPKEDDKPDA